MLANLEVQTFHYKKWSSSCGTSLLLGAFCSPEIQKWIEFVMFLCWSRLKDCDHNINVISYVDTVQNCHGRFHCSSSFLFRCLGWITVILVATVRPPGWRSTSLLLLEVTKNEIAIASIINSRLYTSIATPKSWIVLIKSMIMNLISFFNSDCK